MLRCFIFQHGTYNLWSSRLTGVDSVFRLYPGSFKGCRDFSFVAFWLRGFRFRQSCRSTLRVHGTQWFRLVRRYLLPYLPRGLRSIRPTLRAFSHLFAHPFAHVEEITHSELRRKSCAKTAFKMPSSSPGFYGFSLVPLDKPVNIACLVVSGKLIVDMSRIPFQTSLIT